MKILDPINIYGSLLAEMASGTIGGIYLPKTGAEVATAMGFANAPTALYVGDEASNCTDLVGSANLTDAGSPTHQQGVGNFDTLTTLMDSGSTDAMVASGSTIHDVTTGSWACMYVGVLGTTAPSSGQLTGKRDASSPYAGYEYYTRTTNGYLTAVADDGPTTVHQIEISLDHYADGTLSALMVYDTNSGIFSLHSQLGTTTVGITAGSLSNSAIFAIGKNRLTAAPCNFGLCACWIGSAGEGLTATHRTNFDKAVGINQ